MQVRRAAADVLLACGTDWHVHRYCFTLRETERERARARICVRVVLRVPHRLVVLLLRPFYVISVHAHGGKLQQLVEHSCFVDRTCVVVCTRVTSMQVMMRIHVLLGMQVMLCMHVLLRIHVWLSIYVMLRIVEHTHNVLCMHVLLIIQVLLSMHVMLSMHVTAPYNSPIIIHQCCTHPCTPGARRRITYCTDWRSNTDTTRTGSCCWAVSREEPNANYRNWMVTASAASCAGCSCPRNDMRTTLYTSGHKDTCIYSMTVLRWMAREG